MSIVLAALSCGFLMLKLALLRQKDEHDRRDESLKCQEASIAKLAEIVSDKKALRAEVHGKVSDSSDT